MGANNSTTLIKKDYNVNIVYSIDICCNLNDKDITTFRWENTFIWLTKQFNYESYQQNNPYLLTGNELQNTAIFKVWYLKLNM